MSHPRRWILVSSLIILVLLLAGSAWLFTQLSGFNREYLVDMGAGLPTVAFLAAFAVLPLMALPLSAFLLVAGLKYGFWIAVLIAVITMGAHALTAWWLAKGLLRMKLEAWVERTEYEIPSIPEQHQVWFTVVFTAVPGLPYWMKLYSLALTDLPASRYFGIVWPVHVLGALPVIGMGRAAAEFDVTLLVLCAVLAAAVFGIGYWLKNHYVDPGRQAIRAGS